MNSSRVDCGGAVISVAMTPSGSRIVAGSVDRRVYVLDAFGTHHSPPLELDNEVWAVATDRAGELVAAGTACKSPSDGTLFCYESGRRLLRHELGSPVWSVALSPSGALLAASTWRGDLYLYRREGRQFRKLPRVEIPGADAGCYGVVVSDDAWAAIAAYDVGIFRVNVERGETSLTELPTGLYNLDYNPETRVLLAGGRDGVIYRFRATSDSLEPLQSMTTGQRPVCGVAGDRAGAMIAAGGFDGIVRRLDAEGRLLAQYECDGEIWSLATTFDGDLVAVGSGDGFLHLLRSGATSGAVQELTALQQRIREWRGNDLTDRFVNLAIKSNCYQLLLATLEPEVLSADPDVDFLSRSAELLLAESSQLSSAERLRCARLMAGLGHAERAIAISQELSLDPIVQSAALQLAGECFEQLGLRAAADSSFRRATESRVDRQGIRLLYDLARTYEDRDELVDAERQYEFLLSWDVTFRDAARRLDRLRQHRDEMAAYDERLDYTGLTVSLLGPDVPRDGEVDESLLPVLQARLAELALAGGERPAALESISDMKSCGVFELAPLDPLPYDTVAYMKYEYSPSEDTAKKHLEMLNTVSIIRGRAIRRALDIGTATCRYPQFFDRLGVPFTSGIDISSRGFEHMRSRGMSFARFARADGRYAPILDQSIDLITCMMGTLNHLEPQQRFELLSEVRRILAPGGIAVFGIWDTSCVYQSYLTMYSDSERAVFRTQPLTGSGFQTAALEAGFSSIAIRRFCCFPDSFIYDLELESLGANEVERLCAVDLAVRARLPEAVGQMFLGVVAS